VLDHIPPILGCVSFAEAANNYGWTQTDKRHIKRLLDFKLQGDDVLHRQISEKAELLGMDDLPSRARINKLLQECARSCKPPVAAEVSPYDAHKCAVTDPGPPRGRP